MVDNLCECVRSRIASRQFEGYETEKETIRRSMLETIQFGKCTSMFVVGAKGVGKTMMINNLLDEISCDENIEQQYQVIKLNGYLQGTDELAVEHIVKTLSCEQTSENEFRGTALEYLEHVIESLRQADGSKKSLIIIFDEFHIFCDNEKQLLYNLLDMVNRQSAAICVIGIAKNNSCLETLHERTQSRLATISVYLFPKVDVGNRLDLIRSLFIINEKKYPIQERKKWNRIVEEICSSSEMEDLIENLLETELSEEFFVQFLYHSLLYIYGEHTLNMDAFKNAYHDYNFDGMNLDYKLKNLATLDLCLVIAIYHRCEDYETNVFNFETIYQYYSKVAQKSGHLPQVDRLLALKAFQNLRRLGYIRLKHNGDLDSTPIEYHVHELLLSRKTIKERIRNLSGIPSDLRQWVDNSLHTQ